MIHMRYRSAVLALVGLSFLACASLALAAPRSFKVVLSGAEEVPAVKTSGSGTADLTWDPITRVVTWHVTYSDMSSPVTMAYFHHGARGHNGPVVISLTKKGGPVTSPIIGRATLSPKEAKQFEDGDWYINVHTRDHKGAKFVAKFCPPRPSTTLSGLEFSGAI